MVAPLTEEERRPRAVLDGPEMENYWSTPETQSLLQGARNLRLTANRIGILNSVAIEVRGANGAAIQQVSQHTRNVALAVVTTRCVNAIIKRCIAAFNGISCHRPRRYGCGEKIFRTKYCGKCDRRRDLRAIQQREPFFRGKAHRFQTRIE